MFRTARLSALTLTLLLGACSSRNEDTDRAGEELASQAPADVEEAKAPAEVAPPEPTLDAWKVLGPLLAGSYSGACIRTPDGRNMDATIRVDADGKASAADLKVDFRAAKMAMLMRSRDGNGQYSSIAALSVDEGKGGTLSLQFDPAGKESSASFGRDDLGLTCGNIRAAGALNAQPLYLALARVVDRHKQTISCLDTKNLLVRRNLDVEVANGVVKIGDVSFDMKTALSEGFTFSDAGRTLVLTVIMPDERTINVIYDGNGKVSTVQAAHKQESTHYCTLKD